MLREDALRRLDEIESSEVDPTADVGAYKIMSDLAATPDGLRLLVERYGGSPSANIVGFLALVISEKSQRSTPETAPLTFEFAGRLRRNDYEGVLIGILGAMDRQLVFGAGWGDSPGPPPTFFPFLQHCLNYSGRQSILVQSGAMDVVSALCWSGRLRAAFGEAQLGWIKEKVKELSKTENELLRDAVAELERCLAQESQSTSSSR